MDEIDITTKQLKKLDAQETSKLDAQEKEKNDKDYTQIVNELSDIVEILLKATTKLGFLPSEDTIQIIDDSISALENTISDDIVDELELDSVKKNIRRHLSPRLSKEWKKFYDCKVKKTSNDLSFFSRLISDKNEISLIQKRISDTEEWKNLLLKDNGTDTRLDLLKFAIDSVQQIESSLDLSDDIRRFLGLVKNNQAKVTDLNTEILEWMKKEHLEDKFVINFKN